MNREEKTGLVAELRALFEDATLVVVTHYKGLTVPEVSDLRTRMREAGAGFRVTKNRLTRIALEGTEYAGLADAFVGPTAIAYSSDPVSAAKVATGFAKENEKLVIVAGGLGSQMLDVQAINALADLPSLEALRARLAGMIQTPATRIAGILQQPGGQVARLLSAYARKDEAA